MGTAIAIRFIGSFVTIFAFYWVLKTWFIHDPYVEKLLAIVLLGTATLAFSGINFYFESIVQAKYASSVRIVSSILAALAKVWAVVTHQDLTTIVIIFSAEFTLTALLFLCAYQFKARSLKWWRWNGTIAKEMLQRCGYLIFSSVFAMVYLKLDQVMLGQMTSMEEVGQYAIAARLSEVWVFVPTALVASAYPAIAKLYQDKSPNYQKQLQQSNDILFGLSLSLAIVVQLFGTWLITLIFGDKYADAAVILQIHIWSSVFIFMRTLASRWLILEDLVKFSLYSHIAGALVNVVFNYLLIPEFGAIGAAYATLISYASAGWLIFYVNRKTRLIGNIMTRSLLFPLRPIFNKF
jgi:PST family polysaccharide transporter